MKTGLILGALWLVAAAGGIGAAAADFDYFQNNWNVVGLKDYPRGARVTPDNRIMLAGGAAVQVRFGRELAPLTRAHGKLALEGWMPVMLIAAEDGPVRYEFTYWAAPMPGVKDWRKAYDWPTEGENFMVWVKARAANASDADAQARIQIRAEAQPVPLARAKALVEPPADLSRYRASSLDRTLKPGESCETAASFAFFLEPGMAGGGGDDAELWLRRTVKAWREMEAPLASITVPCRKATEALKAAHVCQMIANDRGEVHGGEGFYDVFYIRDGAYQVMELEEAGMWETARKAVELYLPRQLPDGRFESQKGQFDANGQAVWVLWNYYKMTADRGWLERVYPAMRRAAEWTSKARRLAPADSEFAGLLPNALADGEYLWNGKYHIVGYDFWNLRGILCTAEAARALGKTADAEELEQEAKAYRAAIDAAWKRTGLAHFPPSWEKAGTHWGDTETLWPTDIFAPDDPRVGTLVDHVRHDFGGGYVEGTIRWMGKPDVIHPYMGAYTTMADLARGRDEAVVEDFYWYLLHSTAAHAFPEGIYYKKREAWNDTIPHVTGACNYAIMLRHMLAHEEGDELHLLKAVPDGWLAEGREIKIERLPTWFGELGLTVRGTARGVDVKLDAKWREKPKKIVLHLPEGRGLERPVEQVEVRTRPAQKLKWDFETVVGKYTEQANSLGVPPSGGTPAKAVTPEPGIMETVRAYADAMVAQAEGKHGAMRAPLPASRLDRKTIYFPKETTTPPTGIREGDRDALTGSNPQHDQDLYRLLYELTRRTGDERYARTADRSLKCFLENAQSTVTGLFAWGEHLCWDIAAGTWAGGSNHTTGTHELYDAWQLMDRSYRLAPEACLLFGLGLWEHQINDHESGDFSRHAGYARHKTDRGQDYQRHAGFYIQAWSDLYALTKDERLLKPIDVLLARYERKRNPVTGIVPGGAAIGSRPDFEYCSVLSSLSLGISCAASAAKVPEPLASRMKAFAEKEDKAFLGLPHFPPGAPGKGFVLRVNAKNGQPWAPRVSPKRPQTQTMYSPTWQAAYGNPTTSFAAMLCIARCRQTGDPRYRALALKAADAYLEGDMTRTSADLWPEVPAEILALLTFAWKESGGENYARRAGEIARQAVGLYWDDGPLPRASTSCAQYESITGAPSLALALLEYAGGAEEK